MATEIRTVADLNAINSNLSGDYVQMVDIDMAGQTSFQISGTFTGNYNGNKRTIRNYCSAYPLFEINNGTIQGVRMLDVNMGNASFTGAILLATNNASGWVYECFVQGSLSTLQNSAATIRYNAGKVEKTAVNVTLSIDLSSIWADAVGSLIASDGGGHVLNCYGRGTLNVVGGSSPHEMYNCGGLIGWPNGSTVIENCYSTFYLPPALSDNSNGGLVGGEGIYTATVIRSYYDAEKTSKSDNAGQGEPRTTAEMTYPENFTTTFIDWDFDTVWVHDPSYAINDGYPHFGAGFQIWVKKFTAPEFFGMEIFGDWEVVPWLWVKKGFEWKVVTGVWTKQGGTWKTI